MSKNFIIGVDLGGTNLKIGLLDLKYKILDRLTLNTVSFKKKNSLIKAILDSIDTILKRNKLSIKKVIGVGLGLPGPIDIEKGIVHFFPNIPGWRKVRIKNILYNKLKVAVFVDNDARVMSLAESRLGKARRFNNVICLTLGTGVGGSVIINRDIYRGTDYAAGEIGHVPISVDGPKCKCGGKACLEAYIGNARILKEARRVFGRKISLEELSQLAKKRNKLALKIWDKTGKRLGAALCGVINLLNPDAIVIGGGIANAGKILFDKVKGVVKQQAMSVQARRVKILKANFGNEAGLIGAAILVKEGLGV